MRIQGKHPRRRSPHTDHTPTDPGLDVARLEGLWDRLLEHLVLLYGGHPVGVRGGVVVTPPVPVTLDERPRPEVLQTGPGRGQALAGTLSSSVGVLRYGLLLFLFLFQVDILTMTKLYPSQR